MKKLALLFRVALGVVFIYASVDKILHPQDFADIVAAYKLLPDMLVNPLAIMLPWVELSIGVLLVANIYLAGALFLANALLIVFLGTVILNGVRGIDIACGCFSTDATESGNFLWYITRDSLLLLLGAAAAFTSQPRLGKVKNHLR